MQGCGYGKYAEITGEGSFTCRPCANGTFGDRYTEKHSCPPVQKGQRLRVKEPITFRTVDPVRNYMCFNYMICIFVSIKNEKSSVQMYKCDNKIKNS